MEILRSRSPRPFIIKAQGNAVIVRRIEISWNASYEAYAVFGLIIISIEVLSEILNIHVEQKDMDFGMRMVLVLRRTT